MPDDKDVAQPISPLQGVDVDPASNPEPAPVVESAADAPARDPDTGRFLPTKHTHSRRLTQMALDLGLSKQYVDETPSDQLDDVVYHLNRKVIDLHDQFRRETPRDDYRQQQAAVPPPPEAEPELDPDVHPSISGKFGRVDKKLSRIDALEREVETLRQREQVRENQSWADRADGVFAKLDPGYWGTGAGNTLQGTSAEFLRRKDAFIAARASDEPGSFEDKLRRVCERANPPPAPAAVQAKTYTPEEYAQAGVARPTRRNGAPEPKGRISAIREIDRMLKEKGFNNIGVSEEEAGLPD